MNLLPRFLQKPQPPEQPRHYSLAAQQMATALNIPLEEAQGWVDMAERRARGIRE